MNNIVFAFVQNPLRHCLSGEVRGFIQEIKINFLDKQNIVQISSEKPIFFQNTYIGSLSVYIENIDSEL